MDLEISSDMNLDQYLRYIASKYYPEIEDSILNSFIGIITSTENYCINSAELMNWKIINLSADLTISSLHIKQLFIKNNLVANKDYIQYNTWIEIPNQGGKVITKYILTYISFKKCLMNCTEFQYKNQFILLEYYVHHYNTKKVELLNHINKEQLNSEIDSNILPIGIISLILLLIFYYIIYRIIRVIG